jgi:transcriptional regulator
MYTPEAFAESRTDRVHGLIRDFPLATFIVASGNDCIVNHLPMLLRPATGEQGSLVAHVPRANAVWRAVDGAKRAVAVFQGLDAYISPTWYPSQQAHGRTVPTWNYAVVHVRGVPRCRDDPGWLRAHLEELTHRFEAGRTPPWRITDAPDAFIDDMIGQLVGIEMRIENIDGKWKLSQNRSVADRLGVIAGLGSRGDDRSLAMANLIAERTKHGA